MTTQDIFFQDEWFDTLLYTMQNHMNSVHKCCVITSYATDTFPQIIVQRTDVTDLFSGVVRMNIDCTVCTDYEGCKQEHDIINGLKKCFERSIDLGVADIILRCNLSSSQKCVHAQGGPPAGGGDPRDGGRDASPPPRERVKRRGGFSGSTQAPTCVHTCVLG